MTSPVLPGAREYAEDINAVGDASVRRPAGRMVANSAQSIPHNTATAVAFGAEDYDTHNGHDPVTNNTRYTVPAGYDGYWNFRGTVTHGARTDYAFVDAWFRKNGTTNLAPSGRRNPGTGSQVNSAHAAARVQMVAGDYVELMCQHQNTAAVAQALNQSGQFSSVMEATLDRL